MRSRQKKWQEVKGGRKTNGQTEWEVEASRKERGRKGERFDDKQWVTKTEGESKQKKDCMCVCVCLVLGRCCLWMSLCPIKSDSASPCICQSNPNRYDGTFHLARPATHTLPPSPKIKLNDHQTPFHDTRSPLSMVLSCQVQKNKSLYQIPHKVFSTPDDKSFLIEEKGIGALTFHYISHLFNQRCPGSVQLYHKSVVKDV